MIPSWYGMLKCWCNIDVSNYIIPSVIFISKEILTFLVSHIVATIKVVFGLPKVPFSPCVLQFRGFLRGGLGGICGLTSATLWRFLPLSISFSEIRIWLCGCFPRSSCLVIVVDAWKIFAPKIGIEIGICAL